MRRGDADHDRGLADDYAARSVPDHYPAEPGDPAPRCCGQLSEARHDLLVVGLVVDRLNALASLGTVPHIPDETHHRPAVSSACPLERRAPVQDALGERQPVVALRRSERAFGRHALMVGTDRE